MEEIGSLYSMQPHALMQTGAGAIGEAVLFFGWKKNFEWTLISCEGRGDCELSLHKSDKFLAKRSQLNVYKTALTPPKSDPGSAEQAFKDPWDALRYSIDSH